MCGGFTCSKNALTALNILYILVAFILIGVAAYGRASAVVTNLPIVGGILSCGVFLILVSILGLIGAIKHHQVLLFFYMLILFLLFLVQFSIACACLAFNSEQQQQLAEQGWKHVSYNVQEEVQMLFKCCGFDHNNGTLQASASFSGINPSSTISPLPACPLVEACCPGGSCIKCPPCMGKLQNTISYAFKLCGGIGLFFSFTEVVATVIAYRYRNQYDPNAASAIISRHNYFL